MGKRSRPSLDEAQPTSDDVEVPDIAEDEVEETPKKAPRGEFARERVQGNMFLVRREPDDEEEFPELREGRGHDGKPGRYKVTRRAGGETHTTIRTDY